MSEFENIARRMREIREQEGCAPTLIEDAPKASIAARVDDDGRCDCRHCRDQHGAAATSNTPTDNGGGFFI